MLGSAGVELGDDRVVVGPATIDGGATALDRAWDAGLRPTGILAMSDVLAIGAIGALRRHGLSVPADVSVVGFDDIEVAAHLDPALTTVHQPIARKGREAIELLLAAIDGAAAVAPEHRILGTHLVVRASTGPVHAAVTAGGGRRARGARPAAPRPMSVDTPAWVRDAIFYQVFPDRFAASERVHKPGTLEPWDAPPTFHGFKGGDLRGVAERLGYLGDLGVTALYLNPIFTSASNHRYHTYDYFSVDPLLGGDDALRDLLDAAHDRGMRVVLDGVFNHTGRGFWAFHHILENGAASPYRGWFRLDQARLDAGQPLLAYPPPGTPPKALGYQAWWGLPALPKLDTDDPEVREFLFGVAEHWLRFGIDGWRLDVPEEIADEAFWQEFRTRCRAVNPDAYLVGEIWAVAPDWVRGDRFDGLMNYPLGEAILGFAGGSRLDMAVVRGHDQYRLHVRPTDGPAFAARVTELVSAYDPDVTAVQLNLLGSHDTPRLRTVLGGDVAAVRLAILLQTVLPGAPCLYYGDEIGLVGANDPANRGAFPWDETRWEPGLRESVQALLALRSAEPALRHASVRVVGAKGPAVAFERGTGVSRFVVAVNAGDAAIRLALRFADAPGGAGGHLAAIELPGFARPAEARIVDGNATIELEPRTGAVLRIV